MNQFEEGTRHDLIEHRFFIAEEDLEAERIILFTTRLTRFFP